MKLTVRHSVLKSMFLASMLLFFHPPLSSGQSFTIKRSHSLSEIQTRNNSKSPAPDSLTIIAIRVEFQKDNNRLTTGDGTFNPDNLSYLRSPEITIDPLPHDHQYFRNHLEFIKNYFETVSGNQMQVNYRLLPDIYTLPNKMEAYSPTGRNFTNEKIAQLIKDSWQAVKKNGGFNTDNLHPENTAFAIFHAGVGRDIELVGTNLHKTPQDIPSLFLGKKSLSKLLNEANFEGFAVNESSFRVTNSMVLPRTLSRPGENITGEEFVLQLSINGLMAASVGSYLGLPDLFNTETGNSGIGRFGLMDGESFFSYRGLFPPEPSAWEKYFLGWQTPFSISKKHDGDISLPSASYHQKHSIAKYALSGSEYFLIENRHRDPNDDGIIITIKKSDGSKTKLSFSNHDQTFVNQSNGFTDLLEPGVVTDVDNFDWSLPGGLDVGPDETAGTSDDRILNGGMLIWHIDESVIEQGIQNQGVNINPDRRGVDLEEADGAQDIGRAAHSDFSEQARGTAFDFWWRGNNASIITLSGDTLQFYENRFAPDTTPSNESNSGARSFFEFYDFSQNLPVSSFKVRPISGQEIEPVNLAIDTLSSHTTFTADNNYFNSYPLQLSLYKSQNDSFLVIPSRQTTYALELTGSSSPLFDFQSGSVQQPYTGNYLILGESPQDQQISLYSWEWDGSQWKMVWNQRAMANSGFLSSLNDNTLLLDFTNQRLDITDGSFKPSLDVAAQRSTSIEGNYAQLSDKNLFIQPGNQALAIPEISSRLYTGSIQISDNRSGFYLLTDKSFTIYDLDDISHPIKIVENIPLTWPAMVDFNKDGLIDFLYINKNTNALEARNINGAMLPYFPIHPPKGADFTGTPLISATENSNSLQIYLTSQDSLGINIHSYDEQGKPVSEFPLYVGGVSKSKNKPIHPLLKSGILYALSHKGELKAWKLKNVTEVLWGGRYGNAPYNKVSAEINSSMDHEPGNNSSLLIEEETYNWPNPAENFTNLRFQTSRAGHIDVKIITPDGNIVFEKRYHSNGNAPVEYRIDTRNWSSGLYLAMVTANAGGKKERKMIKMVVIH